MSKLSLSRSNLPLYIFVVAVIDLPRIIIGIFNLPVRYYFGGNPPWLILILLAVFFLNIALITRKFNKVVPVDSLDVLMATTIVVWFLLYLYHSDYSGGGWASWNGAYLITTHIWLFLAFYILKTYSFFYDIRYKIVDVTINVLTFIAVFFLLLVVVDYIVYLPIHDQLQNNNGLAIRSGFCLLLLLFFDRRRKFHISAFIFFIHLILVLQSNARAALLVIIVLATYKIYLRFISNRRNRIVYIAVIMASITLGLIHYEEFLTYVAAELSPFDIFGEAYLPEDGYGIEGNFISVISRLQSVILLLFAFLDHPLLGIGYQNSMLINSFGYISHTFYVFPMASYGLIGIFPYLLMIFSIIYRGLKYRRQSTIATILFVVVVFTFLNDMVAWLAIVIFLIRSRQSGDITQSPQCPIVEPNLARKT